MRPNKEFTALSSAVAIALLVLSGCAPSAAPAPASAATPKSGATSEAKAGIAAATPITAGEQPKYGGVLTSYVSGNPPSLDTAQESTVNTSSIVAPFYSSLVQIDPLTGDKWAPGLAEKWEMSKDGLTWTFDIRQGVKFHDGTPFTVDDAVFSLKRETDPPKGIMSNMAFLLKPVVKSIEKNGNQVKMTLNYPFAVVLDTLGNNYSPVYSEKYIEKNGDMKTTAMGTGPFKFKSYTPGVGLEGVKNPDFWVKGRPYLDGYRVLIIRDEATRLSALRTGKVNWTGRGFTNLIPADMEMVKKENPQVKFYPSPSPNGSWFFMNTRKPPFQDQKVRKAISLAVDRQAAIKVMGQGYGVIGNPFPVDTWSIPNDEIIKTPGFRQPKDADLAEAKKLMQDAGYPTGFELTIQARQMWQSKDAAVFMTNQLAQLGIKAKVNVNEDAVFWETGRKAAHDAMVYTPVWTFTDPQWQGRYWAPGGTLNFSGNEDDKELTSMWDEQIKIVDQVQRKAVIRKVAEHLLDALPGVPMLWYDVFIGIRPEVRNFTPGISDWVGNTLEEIWLAK